MGRESGRWRGRLTACAPAAAGGQGGICIVIVLIVGEEVGFFLLIYGVVEV